MVNPRCDQEADASRRLQDILKASAGLFPTLSAKKRMGLCVSGTITGDTTESSSSPLHKRTQGSNKSSLRNEIRRALASGEHETKAILVSGAYTSPSTARRGKNEADAVESPPATVAIQSFPTRSVSGSRRHSKPRDARRTPACTPVVSRRPSVFSTETVATQEQSALFEQSRIEFEKALDELHRPSREPLEVHEFPVPVFFSSAIVRPTLSYSHVPHYAVHHVPARRHSLPSWL